MYVAATRTNSDERPRDTSSEAWAVTQARLATLRPGEKAQLANTLSIDCERLARAGIAVNEPEASDARICYLLAVRRYGRPLADKTLGPTDC